MEQHTLVHFSPRQVPYLDQYSRLVLNLEEGVVSLVGNQVILAQGVLPLSALRLFVLLLKFPQGCLYPELFACLHCPENTFLQIAHASAEQVSATLQPYTEFWQQRLLDIALQKGPKEYERELKRIRRLIKETGTRSTNIHFMLQNQRFGLAVRVLSKKGYVLRRSSLLDQFTNSGPSRPGKRTEVS